MRFYGFLSSSFNNNYFASKEICSHDFSLNYNSLFYIFSANTLILLLKNGGSPHNKTYIMHPKDHSSHIYEYLPCNTSGATYIGVPTFV